MDNILGCKCKKGLFQSILCHDHHFFYFFILFSHTLIPMPLSYVLLLPPGGREIKSLSNDTMQSHLLLIKNANDHNNSKVHFCIDYVFKPSNARIE